MPPRVHLFGKAISVYNPIIRRCASSDSPSFRVKQKMTARSNLHAGWNSKSLMINSKPAHIMYENPIIPFLN